MGTKLLRASSNSFLTLQPAPMPPPAFTSPSAGSVLVFALHPIFSLYFLPICSHCCSCFTLWFHCWSLDLLGCGGLLWLQPRGGELLRFCEGVWILRVIFCTGLWRWRVIFAMVYGCRGLVFARDYGSKEWELGGVYGCKGCTWLGLMWNTTCDLHPNLESKTTCTHVLSTLALKIHKPQH